MISRRQASWPPGPLVGRPADQDEPAGRDRLGPGRVVHPVERVELGQELEEGDGDRPLPEGPAPDPGQERDEVGPVRLGLGRSPRPGPGGAGPCRRRRTRASRPRARPPPDGPPRSCRPTPRAARPPGRPGAGPGPGSAASRRGSRPVASVDWSSTTVIVRAGIILGPERLDGRRDVRLLVPGRDDRVDRRARPAIGPSTGPRNRNHSPRRQPDQPDRQGRPGQGDQRRRRSGRGRSWPAAADGPGPGRRRGHVAGDPLGGDLAALDHHRHPRPRLDAAADEVEARHVLPEVQRAEAPAQDVVLVAQPVDRARGTP